MHFFLRRKNINSRIYIIPIAVFFIVIAISFVASNFYKNYREELIFKSFEEYTSNLTRLIRDRFLLIEKNGDFLKNLIVRADYIDSAYWNKFINIAEISNNFNEVFAVSYVKSVKRDDLQKFVSNNRKINQDFLGVFPKSSNRESFVVSFLSSQDKSLNLLGYDLSTDKDKADAAVSSKETGLNILSKPEKMYLSQHEKENVLSLFIPIYKNMGVVNKVKDRIVKHDSWLVLLIRPRIFIKNALNLYDNNIFIELMSLDKYSKEVVIFNNLEDVKFGSFSNEYDFNLATKRWIVKFKSLESYDNKFQNITSSLYIIGFVLAFLLSIITYMFLSRHKKVVSMAENMLEELQESNNRFNNLATLAGEFFWETDKDNNIIYLSDRIEEIALKKRKELIGVNIEELVFKNDLIEQDALKQIILTKKIFKDYQFKMSKNENNDFFWASFSGMPVFDKNTNFIGYQGIGLDISSYKDKEKELSNMAIDLEREMKNLELERERYSMSVSGINAGVWDWNLVRNEIYWSDEFYDILGENSKLEISSIDEWFKRIHPDYLDQARKISKHDFSENLDSHKGFYKFSYLFRSMDDKYIFLEERGIPSYDKEGKLVRLVGSTIDITERKNKEVLLNKKTEELKKKNQELKQFAYIASHDLREPLRMISGYLDLLNKRCSKNLDCDSKDFLNYAKDGAKRMDKLILSLLDYSSIDKQELKKEVLNIEDIIDDVKRNLSVVISETNTTINVLYDLPKIYADYVGINRLFQNLISNSIKYRSIDKNPNIEIGLSGDHGHNVFYLKDNGIGIDKKFFDKVFDLFKRLHKKEDIEGNGIGLSVCKKIIERHDGDIWVESNVDEGSIFYFSLPLFQENYEDR